MSNSNSSRPSAFDILLSNSKKKQQQTPTKRKQTTTKSSPNCKPKFPISNCSGLSITPIPNESVNELRKKGVNFDVNKAAYWEKGKRVPFLFLAKAMDAISTLSGRIDITDILCNVLRTVIHNTPSDLLPLLYLLSNRLKDGLKLGIGDDLIAHALADVYGVSDAHIKTRTQVL